MYSELQPLNADAIATLRIASAVVRDSPLCIPFFVARFALPVHTFLFCISLSLFLQVPFVHAPMRVGERAPRRFCVAMRAAAFCRIAFVIGSVKVQANEKDGAGKNSF
ncbi:MAG TPA: hypothetical protein VFE79_22790 [Paraburkholderia sp.]|nr:hypothetical protein [Paraburkholderia sp.]